MVSDDDEGWLVADMFPPGSVSPLLGVVVRLHALSAFAAWDSCEQTPLVCVLGRIKSWGGRGGGVVLTEGGRGQGFCQ